MLRKPGPGWTRLAIGVWSHASGFRIHVYGLIRQRDGGIIDGKKWPESQCLEHWVRIAGGNRRRGVMMWALSTVG